MPARVRGYGPTPFTIWTMPLMTAGGKVEDTENKVTIVPHALKDC